MYCSHCSMIACTTAVWLHVLQPYDCMYYSRCSMIALSHSDWSRAWNPVKSGEYIDDTEDLINIQLDYSRNKLIRFEIVLTTGTFAIAMFSAVASMLGENLALPELITTVSYVRQTTARKRHLTLLWTTARKHHLTLLWTTARKHHLTLLWTTARKHHLTLLWRSLAFWQIWFSEKPQTQWSFKLLSVPFAHAELLGVCSHQPKCRGLLCHMLLHHCPLAHPEKTDLNGHHLWTISVFCFSWSLYYSPSVVHQICVALWYFDFLSFFPVGFSPNYSVKMELI
jgi:hypothetical protein